MKKNIKRWFAVLFSLFLCLTAACGSPKGETIEGKYVLLSAEKNGKSVLSDFQLYTVEFEENGGMTVKISYLGLLQSRRSVYTYNGSVVTEKFKDETYEYRVHSDGTMTTDMVDFEETVKIVLQKETKDDVPQSVDFEGILFGEDMSETKFYNYCPAVIADTEDGREVLHIWYCTNLDDGVIVDYIGYRKGVKQEDGKWLFSEQSIALSPTAGTWDARHTCDPAVIKGEFAYKGETYTYLMAYLGCVTDDYNRNETGLAVAKSAAGPWTKLDDLNPIVPWYDNKTDDINPEQWGTGMPTLTSVDGKGEVILTYQSSSRGTAGIQRWDFSDLDHPERKFTSDLMHNGIVNSQGIKCNAGIVDFAFDPVRGRLYVFGVTNERNPADVTKTLVNSHCVLAYVDGLADMEAVSAALQSGSYTWNIAGYVGPNTTGFERNHNPAIVRDGRGYIPDSGRIGVVVSTGHNSWDNENIFTYRLYGAVFDIAD